MVKIEVNFDTYNCPESNLQNITKQIHEWSHICAQARFSFLHNEKLLEVTLLKN